MNRRRRRNQASAQGQQREPPVAISYRRDLRSPAQVYVSLAQLTTLAQAQHVQSRNVNQERRSERDTDIDPYVSVIIASNNYYYHIYIFSCLLLPGHSCLILIMHAHDITSYS